MQTVEETLAAIDKEIESIRQMHNYAVVARHDFIQRKLETLNTAYDHLAPILGPESTAAILATAMDRMYTAAEEQGL